MSTSRETPCILYSFLDKEFTTWWWPNWVKAETCSRLTKIHYTINECSSSVGLNYLLPLVRFRIKALHSSHKVSLSHNERPLCPFPIYSCWFFLVAGAVYFCELQTGSSQMSVKSSEGSLDGLLRGIFKRTWMTDCEGSERSKW